MCERSCDSSLVQDWHGAAVTCQSGGESHDRGIQILILGINKLIFLTCFQIESSTFWSISILHLTQYACASECAWIEINTLAEIRTLVWETEFGWTEATDMITKSTSRVRFLIWPRIACHRDYSKLRWNSAFHWLLIVLVSPPHRWRIVLFRWLTSTLMEEMTGEEQWVSSPQPLSLGLLRPLLRYWTLLLFMNHCESKNMRPNVFISSIVMAWLTSLLSLLTRSLLLLLPPFIPAVRRHRISLWGLEGRPVLSLTETEVCVHLLWLLRCYLFTFSSVRIRHRLWSKTLSVMEEAQQERQWEARRASLTSPQLRWATGLCLCRPPRIPHSHRQGVSQLSCLIWVET